MTYSLFGDQSDSDRSEEKFVVLRVSCPHCRVLGEATPRYTWQHDVDNGRMLIGSRANYKCESCGLISHVRNWTYICPFIASARGQKMKFQPTTPTILAQALGQVLEMLGEAGVDWARDFLQNLQSNEW